MDLDLTRILFAALKGQLAGFAFVIGRIILLPSHRLSQAWLRLTIPAQISFLEEYLACIDPSHEVYPLVHEKTQCAIAAYRDKLSRINSSND